MDTITLVIATIVIIILFIMLLFNVEIINFINNLSNTTNGTNTMPSDCPDYWIKYSNHKSDTDSSSKYGCYVNSKIQPDVLYNGGKCNYINGERTNFGSMPNYCDVSQNNPSGSELSISNPADGIKLIDGWQSFFTDLNLAAVIAISPQQKQPWNPGHPISSSDSSDISANDHLELRHVGLYKFESISIDDADNSRTYRVNSKVSLLTDAESFTGKSYIMTGFDSLMTSGSILNDNYGYNSSDELNSSSQALKANINMFYKNAYKCGDTFTYDVTGSSTSIDCPTTWSAVTSNLSVDTSYVLIYLDVSSNSVDVIYDDNNNTGHVVSIYDKLTKSAIKKSVVSSFDDMDCIKFDIGDGSQTPYITTLTVNEAIVTSAADVTGMRLNYLEFYIPPYNPNTISDNSNNTVAGYSMDVFDSLSYCQKRIWASKNDIQWSGITDNWSLDRCNEHDFSNLVDYTLDICFNISSGTVNECKYFTTSDASNAAAIFNTGYNSENKYGQTSLNEAAGDGTNAESGYYIQGGPNEGTVCEIDANSNYRSIIDFGNIL